MTISTWESSRSNRSRRDRQKSWSEVLDHHLDHSDAIFFGRAAALPQTLSRGPQKARGAAELTRQFFEEPIEPSLRMAARGQFLLARGSARDERGSKS